MFAEHSCTKIGSANITYDIRQKWLAFDFFLLRGGALPSFSLISGTLSFGGKLSSFVCGPALSYQMSSIVQNPYVTRPPRNRVSTKPELKMGMSPA